MRQTSIAARLVSLLAALIIGVAASPAAAELVAGASGSQAAHAAKKKAAHKKAAHKKKAHKKKKSKKCKDGQAKKNGQCVKEDDQAARTAGGEPDRT